MFRALLASTALIATSAPAFAQTEPSEPTLSLSASADVSVAPEYATISSGVVTRSETAQQAVRANAEAMTQVFDALNRVGVAREDVQTSQLSVSPVYADRREPGQITMQIIGYEARNTVTARLRDTARLGNAIDAMVEAGANNINDVSFGADNTEEALNRARRDAIANLMAKADFFADAAGFQLCGIRRMSESGSRPPQPQAMRMYDMAEASTPVSAGQLTLTANVNADFCITQ